MSVISQPCVVPPRVLRTGQAGDEHGQAPDGRSGENAAGEQTHRMRLISPAIGGVALGIGLAIGANVSGGVLAGYGAALAVALVLMSRSSDGIRRARRGLELLWDAPGVSPDARRLARLKIVGSTLILLLLLVALAGELA